MFLGMIIMLIIRGKVDLILNLILDSHLDSPLGDKVWSSFHTLRLNEGTEMSVNLFNETGAHYYKIAE